MNPFVVHLLIFILFPLFSSNILFNSILKMQSPSNYLKDTILSSIIVSYQSIENTIKALVRVFCKLVDILLKSCKCLYPLNRSTNIDNDIVQFPNTSSASLKLCLCFIIPKKVLLLLCKRCTIIIQLSTNYNTLGNKIQNVANIANPPLSRIKKILPSKCIYYCIIIYCIVRGKLS